MQFRNKQRFLTRKALMLHGSQTLEWHDEVLPEPDAHDVVVETIAGAINIGRELPQYVGAGRSPQERRYPLMTGYESYGRISAVGSAVPEQLLGEMVIGLYGHATHAVLPLDQVIFVPSRITPPTALLAILTCDVARGIRALHIQPEERVLVAGAGARGLLAVWLLKRYGVQTIHVFDPEPDHRDRALTLGATVAVDPDYVAAWPADFSVGLETSGRDAGFLLLQHKMTYGGRLAVLSDGRTEPLTLATTFHLKALTVRAAAAGFDYAQHAVWFWQVADNDMLSEVIFDLAVASLDLPETFEALATGDLRAIKVLVNYQAET